MTTIGGVAFRLLDRLPRVGDKVTYEDIVITVLEMNEHRIARVRVDRGPVADEDDNGEILQQPYDDNADDSISAMEKQPATAADIAAAGNDEPDIPEKHR
jgi:Mg2+/Co2+ transporter CorC